MEGSRENGGDDDSVAEAARSDERPSAGSPSESARSGDFSQDPAFDPEQLFQVIGREENVARVSDAMRTFLRRGDTGLFERAVATFVRSARARAEPVEHVLAALIGLAEAREGTSYPHDWTLTDLRSIVLRGVLLAFYGDTSLAERPAGVERRSGERRRVDARTPGGNREEVF